MSLPSDLRLTDPTPAAVRAALTRALAAANGRRKTGVLRIPADALGGLAERAAEQPEGHYRNAGHPPEVGAAQLALAWWTAPGGRKLVRVRGWRDPAGMPGIALAVVARDVGDRPAVWHLDFERLTRVEANGSAEWVAVCGCGAAGSPVSLAWAGGMCGPCRDRADEHGPSAVAHEPGLLTDGGFTPRAVAFSPCGRRLLAVGDDESRVWDPRTGELLAVLILGGAAGAPVAGDGWFAFPDGSGLLAYVGPPPAWRQMNLGAAAAAYPTGRPGELLVRGPAGSPALYLVTVPTGRRGLAVPPPQPGADLVAVRPDPVAPRAVFWDRGHVVVCRVGPKGDFRPEHAFRLGVGEHDRTGYWAHPPDVVRFTADGERLLFVVRRSAGPMPDQYLELWHPARPKALLQATLPEAVRHAEFSPDGGHLYAAGVSGPVAVLHPGAPAHARARLGWHAGTVSGLAVSPDGRTLATAGYEGVKLWPVARLLEVL